MPQAGSSSDDVPMSDPPASARSDSHAEASLLEHPPLTPVGIMESILPVVINLATVQAYCWALSNVVSPPASSCTDICHDQIIAAAVSSGKGTAHGVTAPLAHGKAGDELATDIVEAITGQILPFLHRVNILKALLQNHLPNQHLLQQYSNAVVNSTGQTLCCHANNVLEAMRMPPLHRLLPLLLGLHPSTGKAAGSSDRVAWLPPILPLHTYLRERHAALAQSLIHDFRSPAASNMGQGPLAASSSSASWGGSQAELPRHVLGHVIPLRFGFIRLPRDYHDLYLQLANQHCSRCGLRPASPALCLLTGQLLCSWCVLTYLFRANQANSLQ